ncbi:MAG TPA: FAD:protein FMN transferase [Acidimicrobiales bacterium]|nr:FAD:protein FMN transferase [Acidimicrobiales bacterium]
MSRSATTTERSPALAIYRTAAWSTRVDVLVTDPGVVVEAGRLLHATLDRVDTVASRFRPDSEVRLLQQSADGRTPVSISADLCEAVGIALRAARLTGGLVDPTVGVALCRIGYDRDFSLMESDVTSDCRGPGPVPGWRSVVLDTVGSTLALAPGTLLDLGATAKAWAADRAAREIAATLGCGVLVSLGGDIAVAGKAPAGGFCVGIADICGDTVPETTVSIDSGGLATSGVGRRHWTLDGRPAHHLVDPATGRPVDSPWRTVSVAAGSCVDANTASTAAMIMGADAVEWLGGAGLPARLVRTDGDVLTVAGWPADGTDVPQ